MNQRPGIIISGFRRLLAAVLLLYLVGAVVWLCWF